MFPTKTVNVFEADGYQYWPAWMLLNFQHTNGATFNNLPLNIISLNSLAERKESIPCEEVLSYLMPKQGFTEFRSNPQSETTRTLFFIQIAKK